MHLNNLHNRAKLLEQIRTFFKERNILEVTTPVLCSTTATDPFIESFTVDVSNTSAKTSPYYLQTSPEYAMKKLLAKGSGCIYQICPAFRSEGSGQYHNPEFTMLEWYRVGFDHHDLMQEVDKLLEIILGLSPAKKVTYQSLFLQCLDLDPLHITLHELKNTAKRHNICIDNTNGLNQDDWLNLLFNKIIEPQLIGNHAWIIYNYPASQAALAKLNHDIPTTAARFEVYVRGIELANGFNELTDPIEQKQRFEQDLIRRKTLGLAYDLPIDETLVTALSNLPSCAGVALGVDRLFMLQQDAQHIHAAHAISGYF